MASSAQEVRSVRFGPFELDLRTSCLTRQGQQERLALQPSRLLVLLVQRRGELVSREELHSQLWPDETFVDFDHGLNNAVNRLREALRDSATSPRYIQTMPRRGYRFIADVKAVDAMHFPEPAAAEPGQPEAEIHEEAPALEVASSVRNIPGQLTQQQEAGGNADAIPTRRRRWLLAAALAVVVGAAGFLFFLARQ